MTTSTWLEMRTTRTYRADRSRFRPARAIALGLALAVAPSVWPAADASAFAQEVERFELPGPSVVIYQPVGRMRVVPGTGPAVAVEAERRGRDADRLELVSDTDDGRGRFRIVYPEREIVYPRISGLSRTTFWMRGNGTFGHGFPLFARRTTIRGSGEGMEAYVDLTVRVPPGTRLSLYLGDGDATITDVVGDIHVDSRSSYVHVHRTRGPLDIDTGLGLVELIGTDGDVEINTGSGDVMLLGVRSDRIRVNTGTGRVLGRTLFAREIEVDSGIGDILLERVFAFEVDLDTDRGETRLDLAGDPVAGVLAADGDENGG